MTDASHFKCNCPHCHGHIECPVEAAGQVIDCPHCGKPTELPSLTPPLPKNPRSAKMIIIGSIILTALTAIGAIWFSRQTAQTARLRQAAETAAQQATQQAADAKALANDPLAQAGWKISTIKLAPSPGSKLIHATGTLTNATDHQRFGVRIKLDLFNVIEQKIGSASDYQAAIEAHGQWSFAALVVDTQAVTAKVAAVEESP